jgi:hypothetical protein
MSEDSFPFRECSWHHNDEQSIKWVAALEKNGPENVRARLAQTDAGPASAWAIGTERGITIGFAQEWLAWHDRRRSEREATFRRRQIFWTRWAAVAASFAATAALVGWAITIYLK